MGISSLGVGSSILTQDVLDQLKAADESQFIKPIDSKISIEEKKQTSYDVVEALVDNVYESLKSLTEFGVFESRTATTSDETVATVIASENSDIQDFTLNVTALATKEIEQSGTFSEKTSTIATGSGTLSLQLGTTESEIFTIDYDNNTTLEELKDLINEKADGKLSATIVQVSSSDFRLMLSADTTGSDKEITITDDANTNLTTGLSNVQSGGDAEFEFNGLAITRSTNSVDDLLSGVTLNLEKIGSANISVSQNTGHIAERITNFVDKYNTMMFQIDTDTTSSVDKDTRGIFSSDSTIKSMKTAFENIIKSVGEVGDIQDYGFDFDSDGRLTFDSAELDTKLKEDRDSVKAFFIGGTFTSSSGLETSVSGVFSVMEEEFGNYAKRGKILDTFSDSISDRVDSLTDQKTRATERLTARYATMAKRFAAFDIMISQFNSASTMFGQLIDAQYAAQNS